MASVNLLVTDGAVAVARRRQVVESRGHYAGHSRRLTRQCGQIGVALEADEAHFLTDQHFRVLGTVRFMAALAALFAHGGMLEGKGSALVAVALETAWLIGARHLHQAGLETTVRVMAVHTTHGALGNAMRERLGECRLDVDVAAFAKCVDVGPPARYKMCAIRGSVYGMA